MTKPRFVPALGTVLVAVVVVSFIDLRLAETRTLVVYTTPALRDLLDRAVLPGFAQASGHRVMPLYLTAGEEYNRLRLSGARPEADVFLHASPLFLEKGYAEGYMEPFNIPLPAIGAPNQSRPVEGGRIWTAFAWSPLVEAYDPLIATPPDLVQEDIKIGFPHPRLSSNGLYGVLLFEEAAPEAAPDLLRRTVVQPVNARATINGVADGSFVATIGYEAVAKFYQAKGAKMGLGPIRIEGQNWTTPVLFCASLVQGHPHEEALDFIRYLYTPAVQGQLERYHFRVLGKAPAENDPVLRGARSVVYDWGERWEELEAISSKYEVPS